MVRMETLIAYIPFVVVIETLIAFTLFVVVIPVLGLACNLVNIKKNCKNVTVIDCPDYNGVAFDMENYESSQGWLFTYRIHMSGCLHINTQFIYVLRFTVVSN